LHCPRAAVRVLSLRRVASLPPASFSFFFLYCYAAPRDLHSFPTRRSSDLIAGDSFEMDAVGALRLSPLRRGLAIDSTVDRRRAPDRKSGSAGMPRPISYAVFCLKKKRGRVARG